MFNSVNFICFGNTDIFKRGNEEDKNMRAWSMFFFYSRGRSVTVKKINIPTKKNSDKKQQQQQILKIQNPKMKYFGAIMVAST